MTGAWVVFPTLNRYQYARIVGARNGGIDVGVIEISSQGSYPIPGWRAPQADDMENRVAVFEDRMAGEVPKDQLSQRLRITLNGLRKKIRVLAVLGWGNPEANIAQSWALANGIPCLLFSETTEMDRRKSAIGEWVKRRLVAQFSAALVGGDAHLSYLRKLEMPGDRIFFGYNAVDNGYFSQASDNRRREIASRARDVAKPNRKHFLCACRLIEIKNLVRLVEAFSNYREMAMAQGGKDPWDLVIVGSGPEQGILEETIRRHGLEECVYLPGVKTYEEMPAWYAEADAFILPSLSEPWGLVVNEAMACGLPVLASERCGSAAVLVREEENGYTFDPTNSDEMAVIMNRLAVLPQSMRDTMGEKSRQIVNQWGPERFAEGMRAGVEKAVEVGAFRPSLLDRLLLKLLILK